VDRQQIYHDLCAVQGEADAHLDINLANKENQLSNGTNGRAILVLEKSWLWEL